jgi:hypothetical protein
MKPLLNAKRADLSLQLLALAIPFFWAAITQEGDVVFFAYFSVGAVQIISFLINTWRLDNLVKSKRRIIYGKWLAVVVAIFMCLLLPCMAGIELFYGVLMVFAFLMLFIGAGLAFFYLSITVDELAKIRKLAKRSSN